MARVVEPQQLCRTRIPAKCADDLEAVCANALAGLVRQLGSLARHAHDIFDELLVESSKITRRITTVGKRADALQATLDQLDYKRADLAPKLQVHAYKRKPVLDQQVISSVAVPAPIAAAYAQCEPPPALNKMNPYRDDGKTSLKFFTDPEYFFRLWCEDMQQQTEKEQLKRRKKKKERVARSGESSGRKKVDRVKKKDYCAMGAEFAPSPAQLAAAAAAASQIPRPEGAPPPVPQKPSSAPPLPPPMRPSAPPPPVPSAGPATAANITPSLAAPPMSMAPPQGPPPSAPPPSGSNDTRPPPSFPPPPPPPSAAVLPQADDGLYEQVVETSQPTLAAPPSFLPPPPPPPPVPTEEPLYGNANADNAPPPPHTVHFAPAPPMPPPPPPEDLLAGVGRAGGMATSGNALLDAILNKRLRTVAREDRAQSGSWRGRSDVAAILARRMAVEASESEGSESESEWSDG